MTNAHRIQFCVITYGVIHGEMTTADVDHNVIVDGWFDDPHVSPAMRNMTGQDYDVIQNVLSTPGVARTIDALIEVAAAFVDLGGRDPRAGDAPFTMALGCRGGRHRARVIGDQLAWRGRSRGWTVQVVHRDRDKPVVLGTPRRVVRDWTS